MAVTIAYLAETSIALAQSLLHRKLSWEEKQDMYQRVVVVSSSSQSAERMVEHLRLTGHIAFIEEEEQV